MPRAITAAEFSDHLTAYERAHGVRISVGAIDTGNDQHLDFHATETVPLELRGFTAAVLVLKEASDDQLAALSGAPTAASVDAGQGASMTLLDTVNAALQTNAPEAPQTLVTWLGGDDAFHSLADTLLGVPPAGPSARSLATLLDDAIYGETLTPDRRGTLRNILLNNIGATATTDGTDEPWEVAGVRDTSQTGTVVEISTLEVPYRASGDAAPLVLATVVTGAADTKIANRAAQEVAQLVTHALPPTR